MYSRKSLQTFLQTDLLCLTPSASFCLHMFEVDCSAQLLWCARWCYLSVRLAHLASHLLVLHSRRCEAPYFKQQLRACQSSLIRTLSELHLKAPLIAYRLNITCSVGWGFRKLFYAIVYPLSPKCDVPLM